MSGRKTDQQHCWMDWAPLLLCLVAMVMRQARCYSVCSLETVAVVNRLLKKLPSQQELYGCRLYTPTPNDYENCSKSMLKCFEKETEVFFTETNENINKKLLRMLNNLGRQLQDKRPPCPACEVYKEEEVMIFLTTLREILQAMNSRSNCSG